MTTEAGYSGWANYPTWNAALWINNDQGLQENVLDLARSADGNAYNAGNMIRDFMEEVYESSIPTDGPVADIFQFGWSMIDWREIGESMIQDAADIDGDEDDDLTD